MNIYLFKTIRDHIMKEKQTAWKVVDDDDDDNDNNNNNNGMDEMNHRGCFDAANETSKKIISKIKINIHTKILTIIINYGINRE